MPQRIITSFKAIGVIIGCVSGGLGFVQAYAIIPYRLTEVEKKSIVIQDKRDLDHDLLIRIAQDVQYLKERSK